MHPAASPAGPRPTPLSEQVNAQLDGASRAASLAQRAHMDGAQQSARTEQSFLLKDYQAALVTSQQATHKQDYSGNSHGAHYSHIQALIGLHDVAAARHYRTVTSRLDGDDNELNLYVLALLQEETGGLDNRVSAALEPMSTPDFDTADLFPDFAAALSKAALLNDRPELARCLLEGFDPACYDCHLAKAALAQYENRPSEAEALLKRATTLGPSLPAAWLALGRHYQKQGRTDEAIAAFAEAHRRGPQWSDPLKYWGDALVTSGHPRQALAKYKAASERAPKWGGLYLAWAEAHKADGRTDKAAQKYREATSRYLTATERARLSSGMTVTA